MSGVITKWIHNDHMAVSWEGEGRKITRLGFVRRNASGGDWLPVAQTDAALVPLEPAIGLGYGVRCLIAYHTREGTIETPNGRPYAFEVKHGGRIP